MSKKVKYGSAMDNSPSQVGYSEGYVVGNNATDRLFGTIFNIIEAIGLSEKQEEALKPLIRGAIWNVFEDSVCISGERHTEIRNLYYEKRKESNSRSVPMSAI